MEIHFGSRYNTLTTELVLVSLCDMLYQFRYQSDTDTDMRIGAALIIIY